MISCPCEYRATTMWKLFDPRSTAARTSGTGRGDSAGLAVCNCWAGRAETAGLTRGLSAEGGPAAAGRGCVWIADHKLRTLESLTVINLSTSQILNAHGVHQELDPHV